MILKIHILKFLKIYIIIICLFIYFLNKQVVTVLGFTNTEVTPDESECKHAFKNAKIQKYIWFCFLQIRQECTSDLSGHYHHC